MGDLGLGVNFGYSFLDITDEFKPKPKAKASKYFLPAANTIKKTSIR